MTYSSKWYWMLGTIIALTSTMPAQSPQTYPNAVTDRLIHHETPMKPPARNVPFYDPDFGSPRKMIRATDSTTNFKLPGTFVHSEGSGEANEWSMDTKKFYVLGKGGQVLVFAFDPATMHISSLPNAASGQALLIPLRPGPSFAFTDPDLIYGTTSPNQLTITSYRFSTNSSKPVIDTRTCGVQPPLGTGPLVRSDDDVSLSHDDSRVSISEGGPEGGKHMFVVVYDKVLGCRWYNTQTGQIGGAWGTSGSATTADSYLIRHAYLSRSGQYVRIMTNGTAWYVWDLATLNVTTCKYGSGLGCEGYGVVGYNSFVNAPGLLDGMQMVKRPLSNLAELTQLYYPLPKPSNWGQPQHFTWSNVDANDSIPVCASTYSYDGDTEINQPYAGEIFCVETDGLASTIWRFAHNRAVWIAPYFQTQPLGDVSMDGKFFIFTSDWDKQLGWGVDGTPRSDVFIVKLD
jgi:hypothetical protein